MQVSLTSFLIMYSYWSLRYSTNNVFVAGYNIIIHSCLYSVGLNQIDRVNAGVKSIISERTAILITVKSLI